MKNFTLFTSSIFFVVGFFSHSVSAQTATDTPETTITTKTDGTGFLSRWGAFLEPFLDYEATDTNIRTSQLPIITDDASGTNDGFGIGGRLGGHIYEAVWLAADLRYSRTSLANSFYQSADTDNFNYGATLGVQTPWAGVRLWGTYLLGGFSDPAEGVSGLNLKFENFKGYRIGAGVHAATVSVNVEYHDAKYGKTSIQRIGSLALRGDTNIDTDAKGYTVSVGFPLEL